MKNYFKRKGTAVEDLFELIFFMVVSLIIVYIFLSSSVVESSKKEEKIKLERNKIELADDFLIYYTTFPAGENRKVADLILEAAVTEDTSELEKITRQILADYFPNQNIALEVKDNSGNKLVFVQEGAFGPITTKSLGEITLPSYSINGEMGSFKITLYQIKQVTI